MTEPRSPLLWTAVYVLAAGLWIVLSDLMASNLFANLAGLQTIKGLAFVVVSAGILYAILLRYHTALERTTAAQEAGRVAERRATVRDMIPYPFVELGPDGSPLHFNEAASELSRTVATGSPAGILPADYREIAQRCLESARAEEGFRTSFEGGVYTWHFSPAPEIGVVYAYGADISHALDLERQLWLAQRMESVGLLAGGIAHDFNNLLTVIKGNAQLARGLVDQEEPQTMIGEIEKASDHAAELVRHLLAYSRQQVLRPREVSLEQLVAGMKPLLVRTIPESITIRTELSPVPPIFADPTQLEQVLLNLVVNAKDAMSEGGTLTVAIEELVLDEPLAFEDFSLPPGHYSSMVVSDTGSGMDESTRKRIFEPFFTTKPPGTGTGLGLATAYGIVKQSRGYIHAESEPGEGTRFTLHFPVA